MVAIAGIDTRFLLTDSGVTRVDESLQTPRERHRRGIIGGTQESRSFVLIRRYRKRGMLEESMQVTWDRKSSTVKLRDQTTADWDVCFYVEVRWWLDCEQVQVINTRVWECAVSDEPDRLVTLIKGPKILFALTKKPWLIILFLAHPFSPVYTFAFSLTV